MKNLLILMFLPLFSAGISLMISRPVPCEPLVSTIEGRRYVWGIHVHWNYRTHLRDHLYWVRYCGDYIH